MAKYKVTLTQTRDAEYIVEAPTEEHARVLAAQAIEEDAIHYFPEDGYNAWINTVERIGDSGWEHTS